MGASITLTMKCSYFNWSALTEVSRGMARKCRGISARSSELAPNLDIRVLTCNPAWADAIRAHDQCLVIGLTFPHHDLDSYLFPMFSFSRTTSSHTIVRLVEPAEKCSSLEQVGKPTAQRWRQLTAQRFLSLGGVPSRLVLPAFSSRRRMNIELNFPPNFERLVLGCIDADFCK